MSAQEWVLIISGITGGVAAIIAAVFAGLVQLKQLPRVEAKQEAAKREVEAVKQDVAEVKTLANVAAEDRTLIAANLAVAEKIDRLSKPEE